MTLAATATAAFIVGILMVVVAEFRLRLGTAPRPAYLTARFPWTNRAYYRPAGYWLQLVGWLLTVAGLVVRVGLWLRTGQ